MWLEAVYFSVPGVRAQDKPYFLHTESRHLSDKGIKVDNSEGSFWPLSIIFKFRFPQSFQSSFELVWFLFPKRSSPLADSEVWGGIQISGWGRQQVGETSLWFWYVKNHHSRQPCCPNLPRPKNKSQGMKFGVHCAQRSSISSFKKGDFRLFL